MRLAAIRGTLLALVLLAMSFAAAPAAVGDKVFVIDIRGAISVAAHRQVTRAIQRATEDKAAAVVIVLDTPGGLVTETRDIIHDMVASPVPVLILVGPSGARAASAGTYLVYASHLAAMEPGTNLGAATPVSMGGLPGLPQPKEDEKTSKEPGAVEKKSINDAVALLRSLGQMRNRNLDFAEKAVREAATMTADEAQMAGVVEFIAHDVRDFLAQADGRQVKVGGRDVTLMTRGSTIEILQPEWRTRLLGVIADPNVAFILLLIGVYGLLFEFLSPGAFLPGVLGGISLLLAMIALSLLPVDYGALALVLLGIAMMIGEAFTPSGALGIGGVVAFLVGALFLYEGQGADFDLRVSLPVIAGAGLACAGLSFFVLGAAIRARQRPPVTGAEEMLALPGIVIDWDGARGNVRIRGEVWAARGDQAFKPGDVVRVASRDGLVLNVEPAF